ncbi:glycoside hydrolase family 88 protein [uncultured Rikenella sp.]|uniref:glycoside hydrolase family 88 protein n=1 Tax=uncultured Rikenella sp. TaxID=368003 RepID=UPI00261F58FF|nr:glycoside hydrolase family 88 protein [uncultured Rikenella sp.]
MKTIAACSWALAVFVAGGGSPVLAKGGKAARVITENVDFAARQVRLMVDTMDTFKEIPSPRTTDKNGRLAFTTLDDWTSGFFPGTLWYLYELTGDSAWLEPAVHYTEGMERIKYYRGNHDIGFMIFCSFGNGLRLTGKPSYKDVIVTAAKTLSERYRPGAGVIQSWPQWRGWDCPVIIDNMMNLELLFEATRMSGDSSFWKIAVSHADRTMEHHYRPDKSCYHVVDYDSGTGEVRSRVTAQGYADGSAWARGQAWGLYGYTMCYRYTRDPKYLKQAEEIARFIFTNKNLPEDLVPYWDYDVPNIGNEPRDASAAAITASALYELSTYADRKQGREYRKLADRIVKTLASPAYRAELGENGYFILMHSTGNKPGPSEVDVPLVYADYYFLEALKRKRDLEAK